MARKSIDVPAEADVSIDEQEDEVIVEWDELQPVLAFEDMYGGVLYLDGSEPFEIFEVDGNQEPYKLGLARKNPSPKQERRANGYCSNTDDWDYSWFFSDVSVKFINPYE